MTSLVENLSILYEDKMSNFVVFWSLSACLLHFQGLVTKEARLYYCKVHGCDNTMIINWNIVSKQTLFFILSFLPCINQLNIKNVKRNVK